MKFVRIHLLLGWLAVLPPADAAIDASFESGGLSHWTVNIPWDYSEFEPLYRPAGSAEVVSAWTRGDMPQLRHPVEGDHYLALGTDEYAFFTNHLVHDITASQTLVLEQGQLLTGTAFYYNGDFAPQDSAWVRVFDDSGTNLLATPWIEFSGSGNPADLNSVPYRQASPWTLWEWTAPVAGTYTLALGVTTFGDNRYATFGFFDSITVRSPIPEPSSAALLVGLLATGWVMRGKFKA